MLKTSDKTNVWRPLAAKFISTALVGGNWHLLLPFILRMAGSISSVHCRKVQCSAQQIGAIQCITVKNSALKISAMQCIAGRYSALSNF